VKSNIQNQLQDVLNVAIRLEQLHGIHGRTDHKLNFGALTVVIFTENVPAYVVVQMKIRNDPYKSEKSSYVSLNLPILEKIPIFINCIF
jgi:hypothetical protein